MQIALCTAENEMKKRLIEEINKKINRIKKIERDFGEEEDDDDEYY